MSTNGNDLQTYISVLIQRRDKLLFLKAEIPEAELIHIFLRGLHSVFQPLQVYFAIPGNAPDTFDRTLDIVRRFAATPVVYGQLCKLKSPGLSQSMFPAIANESVPNESINLSKDRPFCIKFAKTGTCNYGSKCKFQHVTQSSSSDQKSPSAKADSNRTVF